MEIMRVVPEDAGELLQIYGHYIENTAISFEYDVPSVEEFRSRIETTSARLPYIKAVEDGRILGYAYAGPFKGRRAYDWSVETSIYLDKDARRKGAGRALYEAMEWSLRDMGILNMNACITATECEDDPYLTDDSPNFHKAMGFELVGTFHRSGYKFGRWYNMIWMEKILTEDDAPAPVRFGDWRISQP